MNFTKLGISILGLTLASGLASAASVTGTLGLSGFVNVFATEYQFGIDSNNQNSQTAAVASGSGSFAGLGFPDIATVSNLFSGTGAGQVNPGGPFATPVQFISVATTGGTVDIQMTSLPITSAPVCNGVSDTAACRPNGGSAIVLEPFGTGTEAVLQANGTAFYTTTPATTSSVSILLSANFAGMSIDQILAEFATSTPQHVGTNYSDNLVITAVPEPSALAALGLGLVGFGAWKKRKAAR